MITEKGFLLIEVCLSLTAVFLVTVFCISTAFRTTNTSLIDALRMLQVEIFCAQQQALSSTSQCRINFFPEENIYQIIQFEKPIIHKLPKNIVFGVTPGTKGPPGKPVSIIQNPINFEKPYPLAAIIHAHGKISSGTVYLMHTSGRAAGAITVTPHQIAHIRVYILKNGTWEILTT